MDSCITKRKGRKSFRLLFLFIMYVNFLSGSDYVFPDSLSLFLKNTGIPVEHKIRKLNELSAMLVKNDLQKAKEYSLKSYSFLDKCNDPELRGETYRNMSVVYMLTDSGLNFAREAIREFHHVPDDSKLADSYLHYANLLRYYGRYDSSLVCYIKAKDIFAKNKDKLKLASVQCELGFYYKELFNYDKAYDFAILALDQFKKLNDKNGIADATTILGECYFNKNDTLNIFKNVQEQINLYRELGIDYMLSHSLSNMGDAYMDYTDDFDKALAYLFQSEKLAEEINRMDVYINTVRKIARAYEKKGELDSAVFYMNKAIEKTDSSTLVTRMYNDLMLTYIYIEAGDADKAMDSFDSYRRMMEKIHSEELNEKLAEMEVLYESDKKENRIKLLEKEKRIAGLYMAGIAGLFLISLLTAIIIIRQINYRKVITEQEMLIKEQKIIEMEKDKQIIAANAVMEGEETERKRLARDLHDGLGGLLSGLKYSLLNVKGNFVTTDKSAAELDYSIVLLDNSIQELRRVAQNMMPQSLLKLGLKDALSDFCETAGKTKNMIINYHYFGQEERMPSKFETAIYRIVQELVNNSLKHSEADDILVQVVHDTNRVHVFVRDNGKGFNFDGNNTIKGIGLASIKSRVDALNARLDINTSPGHGTEVNLEMFF